MLIVLIVLGFVAIGILIYGLQRRLQRQVRTLQLDVDRIAARQSDHIEAFEEPDDGPRKGRHLRLVKGVVTGAGIGSAVQWVRAHPGPAVTLASSAAAIAVLMPAAVPDDTAPLPIRPPGTAEPLTSPPPPTGVEPTATSQSMPPSTTHSRPRAVPDLALPGRRTPPTTRTTNQPPTTSRPPTPAPTSGELPPPDHGGPPGNVEPSPQALCVRLDLHPLAEVGACIGVPITGAT